MEKVIPYEKLSKKGSETTATGGGSREWRAWQRLVRCGICFAGHRRKRTQEKEERTSGPCFLVILH